MSTRSDLVQACGLLRGAACARSRTPTATASATSAACARSSTTSQWLGVDCLWIPPFYTSPLRDGGYDVADYDEHPARGRHARRLPGAASTTAHERGHQGHRRLRHEPHERPARVVPAVPHRPRRSVRRLLRLVRHRRPLPGRAGHLRRHRAVELDLGPGAPAVLLAPLLQPPARPQLRQPDGARRDARRAALLARHRASTASGSTPCRTSTSGPAPTARTCPRRTTSCARSARRSTTSTPAGCCSPRPTSGRPTSSTTSATSTSGGDECHMCFHFPVMPRIFMAVRRESRYPISEILEETPAIPDSCQWGIFLRNHDELTLEMVTDEDRDYMWSEYAKDPRMKANIGIRRRLAPLLDNDINQMELFTALLLSLPGSPVLYYGDEIGMGDNIWLGDRDGVRTPMQWTPDRNAGFSTATPGRLTLPPVMDPVFGYQSVNVEAAAREHVVAAALDPADDPRPQAAPGVRPGLVHRPRRQQPQRLLVQPRLRRRHRALRQQPVPLPPAGRARPAPLGGQRAGRAARPRTFPRSASCPTC